MLGMRGQRRVEHRADPAGPDRHVAELAGLDGEALGLLALAAEGLDDHGAVEGLVGDLADLGAQLLGPRHQRRGGPLVEHRGDRHRREDQHPDEREHDVGEQHLDDRDDQHRHRADRHRQRRDRAPRGLHVGVRVGEQLPGRVPLVPLHREGEVLAGDRAAVVRLHAVLHDAGAEPAGDDADRAEQGHADEQPEDRPEDRGGDLAVLERGQHGVLGGPAEHPRVGDGQRAEEDTAERGQGEDPGLAADGHGEYGEPVTQGGGSGGHQMTLCPATNRFSGRWLPLGWGRARSTIPGPPRAATAL